LEREEEEAEEALEKLQEQLSTAVARLSRIRKIKKQVKERHRETFQRGMEELDREDGIVSALDAHEQGLMGDFQAMGVPDDVDWNALGLGSEFSNLGPLLPVDSGDPGGTVVTSTGSS
jgi:hypothetical protein